MTRGCADVTLHENGRNKAVLFYDTEQSEQQLGSKNISNPLCGDVRT